MYQRAGNLLFRSDKARATKSVTGAPRAAGRMRGTGAAPPAPAERARRRSLRRAPLRPHPPPPAWCAHPADKLAAASAQLEQLSKGGGGGK